MAFTQTDLDNIDRAIASGAMMVVVDGKTIQYRTMDDMLRVRNLIAQSLAGTSPRRPYSIATFSCDEST